MDAAIASCKNQTALSSSHFVVGWAKSPNKNRAPLQIITCRFLLFISFAAKIKLGVTYRSQGSFRLRRRRRAPFGNNRQPRIRNIICHSPRLGYHSRIVKVCSASPACTLLASPFASRRQPKNETTGSAAPMPAICHFRFMRFHIWLRRRAF